MTLPEPASAGLHIRAITPRGPRVRAMVSRSRQCAYERASDSRTIEVGLRVAAVSASTITLLVVVAAACAVEVVEALTIVVAVGTTRGWRSALEGAAAAVGGDPGGAVGGARRPLRPVGRDSGGGRHASSWARSCAAWPWAIPMSVRTPMAWVLRSARVVARFRVDVMSSCSAIRSSYSQSRWWWWRRHTGCARTRRRDPRCASSGCGRDRRRHHHRSSATVGVVAP